MLKGIYKGFKHQIYVDRLLYSSKLTFWMMKRKICQNLVKGGRLMTKNQIEYNKLLETKRANLVQEDLTRWRDRSTIDLGMRQLSETARHNLAQEGLQRSSLDEQSRHNRSDETIRGAQVFENVRHNIAGEKLESSSQQIRQQEADTHVRAQTEIERHNLESERYNRDVLLEQNRHNVANETETARHNRVSESVDWSRVAVEQSKVGLGYAQLAETQRSNMRNENINQQRANTDYLTKTTQLRQEQRRLGEVERHNAATELEQFRSNMAREAEINRSNIRNENISAGRLEVEQSKSRANWFSTITNSTSKLIPLLGELK